MMLDKEMQQAILELAELVVLTGRKSELALAIAACKIEGERLRARKELAQHRSNFSAHPTYHPREDGLEDRLRINAEALRLLEDGFTQVSEELGGRLVEFQKFLTNATA